MAVIAHNCPDIEVVVVDINEGALKVTLELRLLVAPLGAPPPPTPPPTLQRAQPPPAPSTKHPETNKKNPRAHQGVELGRAPHLRAGPRRHRPRLPRPQPLLQHRRGQARRRGRRRLCLCQHADQGERHRRGPGGRPDLLGGRRAPDRERRDVEQDRGGKVHRAGEDGRGDRQGAQAQLRGGRCVRELPGRVFFFFFFRGGRAVQATRRARQKKTTPRHTLRPDLSLNPLLSLARPPPPTKPNQTKPNQTKPNDDDDQQKN